MLKSTMIGLALSMTGVALTGIGSAYADAPAPQRQSPAPLVLAANGCGPGYFRTLAGNCVPNLRIGVGPRGRVIAPPPCPRGFLRDPNPARPLCYPVY